MPYANLTINLSDADRQDIIDKIANIETSMPYLVQLTPAEKTIHLRLGKKTPAFFSTVLELAAQNAAILPGYFDLNALKGDVKDYQYLSDVLVQLTKLQTAVKHTMTALEQEGMLGSLNFYRHCQSASLLNVVGAQEAVNRLKPFMSKTNKKKKGKEE